MLLGGCLDVDRQPGSEPVSGLDVLVLGAGHHLHVDVSLESVLVADRVDDLDEALGGLGAVASDAGAEEQSADGLPPVQLHEGTGELVHLEGVSLSGDPVAVGAVSAVHLAKVGKHDPHQVDVLAVWHGGAVDAVCGVLLCGGYGPPRSPRLSGGDRMSSEAIPPSILSLSYASGDFLMSMVFLLVAER